MKICLRKNSSGNVLLVCLFIAGMMGLLFLSYAKLTSSHQFFNARSQSWNLALAAAEAGIEEALAHLNYAPGKELESNGWKTLASGKGGGGSGKGGTGSYYKKRMLNAEAWFEATIDQGKPTTITAKGYFRSPISTNFVARTILATCTTTNRIFSKAMIAKKHLRINTSGAVSSSGIDSFDSTDPKFSTNGQYTAAMRKANAEIATTSGQKNAIRVNKADIYGSASTAPQGGVEFKNNGAVGDVSWHLAGESGMQPGHFASDFTYAFPVVKLPFTGTAVAPPSGTRAGVSYQYILSGGIWQLDKIDLKENMLVTGDATLYVSGDFESKGADIIIDKNASLKLYMGGGHFHLKGQGILVDGPNEPTRLQYFGMTKNKCIKMDKSADFTGLIYAPNAKIMVSGSSEITGAIVGKCVHMKNGGGFHYDEGTVKKQTALDHYVVTGWREI